MTTGPYIRVGEPDTHPSKPSHVAGIHQGNRPGKTWRERAIRKKHLSAEADPRRSTGINPESHGPIDPRSPKLTPA
jgi:hypothetical protein